MTSNSEVLVDNDELAREYDDSRQTDEPTDGSDLEQPAGLDEDGGQDPDNIVITAAPDTRGRF